LLAAIAALSSIAPAPAQMMDGHRGVCSDCHVGASDYRYELSRGNSVLMYSVDVYGFSKAVGTFDGLEGGFVFDPDDVENASILTSIDVASLETNDSALNSLVLSERFLDAAAHPLMTFQSTAVESLDATSLRVDGTLSLRGIEKPLSLAVELNKLGPHPLTGKQTAGLVVQGLIKRSEFGITLGLPEISDEIAFTVYAQGSLLE
jgi:polyisoprenoid-binding protein YceI